MGECIDCWFYSDKRTSVCTNPDSEYADAEVNWCHHCDRYQRKYTMEDLTAYDRTGISAYPEADSRR